MKVGRKETVFAAITPLLAAVAVFSFAGCGVNSATKTGRLVSNAVEGSEKTEYVFCVSRNSRNAQKYLDGINAVIDSTDCGDLITRYLNNTNRRQDFLGELTVEDNTGDIINVYTSVLSPYQYSGAYGNGVDGVDMYLMVKLADNLEMKPAFYDLSYNSAYAMVKSGKGDILATAVALTEQVKTDFEVSKVYSSGYQQIISDEAENFKKLSDLKGMKIGALSGRTGYTLVKNAIDGGVLKGTSAEIIGYENDAEAYSAYLAQECDVLVVDEYSAKVMLK